jgi:Putative beta-barrel porin-2, OmpL-like. bbp2
MNFRILPALGLLAAAGISAAADAPPAKVAPTFAEVLDASGISATGYVEAAYEYISTTPSYRVFDTEHSAFSLHQAAMTLAYQPKDGFGAVVNLTAGNDAQLIHSYGSMDTGSFDVTQAFVQYAHGAMTVIGGKYTTLAGAETINPTTNTNMSRSILFGYAVPFTHTGVRATFAATDSMSFVVGLNNGWDQVRDYNSQKTTELGFAYTTKPFVLLIQGYIGSEPTSFGTSESRELIDAVATFNATDSLSFVLNYDYGKQDNAIATESEATGSATWSGIAGYLNYTFNPSWRFSGRVEYFDDSDGYRLGSMPQKLSELTLTFAYMAGKNFEMRFEGRYDKSNESTFSNTDGSKTDKQYSLGIDGIYKF